VASQVATVDQLSGGRVILSIGVGALATDLPDTGEETDLRARAGMMDEGIELMRRLWDGRRGFAGTRYRYSCDREDLVEAGRPVQSRIPIWVVGVWPRPKSMRRVCRCDGVLPQYADGDGSPEQLRQLRRWLDEHHPGGVDVVAEGETPADDPARAAALVAPWEQAGATWWTETRWEMPHNSAERMQQIRTRIEAGPPRRS
jgi:alkanesulfonate monooxygenase SsuD/methylene tetrahydromethanopterin reductase-like flavin-dependent oxidoreductase (luciferase family)